MRNASPALIALLNSNAELLVADCLTIIQQDGTITRLTNFDQTVTVVSQYDNASHAVPRRSRSRAARRSSSSAPKSTHSALTLTPDPDVNFWQGCRGKLRPERAHSTALKSCWKK
jgi:hypothetical protein